MRPLPCSHRFQPPSWQEIREYSPGIYDNDSKETKSWTNLCKWNPCQVAPKPCKGQPGNPKKSRSRVKLKSVLQYESLLQTIISQEIQSIGVTSSLSKLKWYRPILDRSWHKDTTSNLANSGNVIKFSYKPFQLLISWGNKVSLI